MTKYYRDIGDALRSIGVLPDSLDSAVERIVGDNLLLNHGFAKIFVTDGLLWIDAIGTTHTEYGG